MLGASPVQEPKAVAEVKALTQLVRDHRDQGVREVDGYVEYKVEERLRSILAVPGLESPDHAKHYQDLVNAVADFAVRDIANNAGFDAFDQRRRLLSQAFRIAEFHGLGDQFRMDLEFRTQTLGSKPGVAATDLGTFVVPFVLKYATARFAAANAEEEQQRLNLLLS